MSNGNSSSSQAPTTPQGTASTSSSTSSSSSSRPQVACNSHTQARAWCFTLNNYSSVDVPRTIEKYKYVTWQAERGANGTPHLQGYVLFDTPRRFAGVKKIFPTAHWEPRQGTHEQARDYCQKPESRVDGPWTLGSEDGVGQGTRSDVLSLKRSIDEGASDVQLWEDHFKHMLKYHKGASIYKRLKATVRDFKTFVTVITGPTGTGKSHAAFSFPDCYFLSHPGTKNGQLWFDGYDGQRTVVIDEFYGWIPYDLLLRLLDRFPLAVPTKGGFTNFAPKFIVITSNKPPEDWYKFEKFAGKSDPLLRRLDLIITKWTREVYQVMKCPDSPNQIIEINEDTIDFKRFVPNFEETTNQNIIQID